ncbi:ribosomal protection-like ABC-F family protein [Evansella halocellulosilytica]|uniref:ribosomal protection-like ABC-F family protein n=1 Tax=Evansella halocellulosilytica TaxID=2011013 RepID=UPI000BB73174|nr:ABC-F type ribosomal protection protein [Evansella halocellulosilytica]
MLLIEAKNIEKSYGDRTIIQAEHLQVYDRERIGVVGKNGEGKSTLLKILVQELEPDQGEVQSYCSMSYIPQLEDGEVNPISKKAKNQWHIPDRDKTSLSGGEETRMKIAAAFSTDAKLIVADEPTSHLDIQGVEKIEEEMKTFSGAIVMISHDRELLNEVCTSIWEVDNGSINCFQGNYDAYVEQKEHVKERQVFEYEQYIKEKRRLEEAAVEKERKSSSLKKAPSRMGNSEARLHKRSVGTKKAKLDKNAKAIQARIDQLEKKEKPTDEKKITFDVLSHNQIHSKVVLSFDHLAVQVGKKLLFEKFTGMIKPGARVAVLGKNGSGKSTLLNIIANENNDNITIAKPVKLGYFHQKLENLDENKSILENILTSSPHSEQFVRTVLSRLNFKRDDVNKKVMMLSGGERVKTALAKVFLGKYNVLLLDEPTNYLDLSTKDALQTVLEAFPGTVIFVSHDRYFIKNLATHFLQIEKGTAVLNENVSEEQEQTDFHEEKVDKMKLDLEITETISKLSLAVTDDEKQRLELKYRELLNMKKKLN